MLVYPSSMQVSNRCLQRLSDALRQRRSIVGSRWRRLSHNQKQINAAHARQRGPGERANAQLKSWKVLRRIRACPSRATALVQAITVLIQTG